MRSPFAAWWRKCLCALAFALAAGNAPADPQWGLAPNASQAQVDDVLNRLAALPSLETNEIDLILTRLHFTPELRPDVWAALPARAKLETAHRWAQAVSDENGVAFIHAVARDLALRYDSIRFDSYFATVFHGAAASGPHAPPAFRRPAAGAIAPLAPEMTQMLNTLADYIDGTGPLSRVNLAMHRFDLEGQKLDQALGKRKPRDFLAAAVGLAPKPPPVHERLNLLMRDVLHDAESAGHDRRLASVAADLHALFGAPPDHLAPVALARSISQADLVTAQRYDTPANPVGPTMGGSPQRFAEATQTHANFDAKFHPPGSNRSFRSVRSIARGRGGVIAGADVSSALAPPRSIRIVLAGGAPCGTDGRLAKGSIEIRTASASYQYPNVSCDILYAASRVAYQPPGAVAWTPGEAIGLASIDTAGLHPTFPLFVPADGNPLGIGSRWRMLLHPALIDTDIGSAVGLIDMWPRASQQIVLATGKERAVQRWLTSLDDVATWKWSDSPARIVAHGGTLSVVAQRGKTLLTMRTFTRMDMKMENLTLPKVVAHIRADWNACQAHDDMASQHCRDVAGAHALVLDEKDHLKPYTSGRDSTELAAAAPALVARIPDFARAEEFLRALAVFRWARQSQATLEGDDVAMLVPRPKTMDTVVVGVFSDFIASAGAAADWQTECGTVLGRLQALRLDQGAGAGRKEFAVKQAYTQLVMHGILTLENDKVIAHCEPP